MRQFDSCTARRLQLGEILASVCLSSSHSRRVRVAFDSFGVASRATKKFRRARFGQASTNNVIVRQIEIERSIFTCCPMGKLVQARLPMFPRRRRSRLRSRQCEEQYDASRQARCKPETRAGCRERRSSGERGARGTEAHSRQGAPRQDGDPKTLAGRDQASRDRGQAAAAASDMGRAAGDAGGRRDAGGLRLHRRDRLSHHAARPKQRRRQHGDQESARDGRPVAQADLGRVRKPRRPAHRGRSIEQGDQRSLWQVRREPRSHRAR